MAIVGMITGEMISSCRTALPRNRPRTSASDASVPITVETSATSIAIFALNHVALIQPPSVKYASYHCSVNPVGGNSR